MKPCSTSQQNNQRWWLSLQKGSKNAFESLYTHHANALVAYGLKITSEQEIVNDALQDVFIHIWKKKEQLPLVENIRAYLLKSIRNRIIRILESRNLNGNGIQPHQAIQESFEQHLILEELAEERIYKVYQSIQNLPTRQREVINLRYFQNLKTEEIAELLDINYQSVSNLLYKGIQKMRAQLTKTATTKKGNQEKG